MALTVIAEGLVRLEHKVDALLRHHKVTPTTHFYGLSCPACSQTVDYQIDFAHGVVVRKCGCKTGKIPPMPLLPLNQGAADGRQSVTSRNASAGSTPTEDRPRRKGR